MNDATRNVLIPLPGGASKAERVPAAKENHRRQLEAIGREYNQTIEDSETRLRLASEKWEFIFGQEKGRLPTYSSALFYWPFMVLLALCEAPVNRLSFELFFGESPLLSLAVSLLVGMILIALAHSTGIVSRRFRYSFSQAMGPWPSLLQLGVMVTLITLLCYGVAVLRQGYLSFVTQPDPSFAALLGAGLAACTPPAQAEAQSGYCQYSTRSALFLIDRTTPYDETDRATIVQSVGAVVEGLGVGDRIVVATIGPHYSVSQRVIDECKPGCPSAANPIEGLIGSCRAMMAMRDERNFMGRLVTRVAPLVRGAEEAPRSDITGTIAQWTQHPPGGRGFTEVYVFSDMLENSQALPWASFRTASAEASLATVREYAMTPSVRGASVRIVGFGRLHDAGRPPLPAELDLRLRTFWRGYFSAGGARDVSFEGAIG